VRKAVITGLGIVSCIGNNKDEVLQSLREGRSGITAAPEYKEMGFRSQVHGKPAIELESVIDRKLLRSIVDKFGGGPVGLETLGAALSEDAETIEDVYEPYLMQKGYLQRTPRGRVATEGAYRHLGATPPGGRPLWEA